MRYCLANHDEPNETKRRFNLVRSGESSFMNRRIRFLYILSSAAPLIGLLGTVIGMLQTFSGLSIQDSNKTDLVASGISQALITTQAGLLVAIPAVAFIHLLQRKKKNWIQ